MAHEGRSEQVLLLVENAGESLRDASAWGTLTRLIMSTQLSPEASQTALKALILLSKEPILCAVGFVPCLEAAAAFMEKSTNVSSLNDLPHFLLSSSGSG